MRLTRLQVLVTSLLLVASMSTPAHAATFHPTLTLNRSSGAVGSTVIVSGTQALGQCGGVTFGPSPRSPGPKGTDFFGSGSQPRFQVSYVIPPYLEGGFIPNVVVPGPYVFEIACDESNNPATEVIVTVPFTVTSNAVPPGRFVGMASTPDGGGYWLAEAGGGVSSYGDAHLEGSLPRLAITPVAPIVGIAATPTGSGYWLAGGDGGVFSFGSATFHGSLPALHIHPVSPIVGITSTPDGGGYWLVASDGGIFTFGDAGFLGSAAGKISSDTRITSLAATPGGQGYWMLEDRGPVLVFGDAANFGQVNSAHVPPPHLSWVGIALTPTGRGYLLAEADGRVVAFGDAVGPQHGDLRLNQLVVGISPTPSGKGHWLAAGDGGVFTFGDAGFHGSAA